MLLGAIKNDRMTSGTDNVIRKGEGRNVQHVQADSTRQPQNLTNMLRAEGEVHDIIVVNGIDSKDAATLGLKAC